MKFLLIGFQLERSNPTMKRFLGSPAQLVKLVNIKEKENFKSNNQFNACKNLYNRNFRSEKIFNIIR